MTIKNWFKNSLFFPLFLVFGNAYASDAFIWKTFKTKNGCLVYATGVPTYLDALEVSWSGSCEKGKEVSGLGKMAYFDRVEEWTDTISGNFVSGVPHGPITFANKQISGEKRNYINGCWDSETRCTPYLSTTTGSTKPQNTTSIASNRKLVFTERQCLDRHYAIKKKFDTKGIPENSLEYDRKIFEASKAEKELYSGECSHLPQSATYIRFGDKGMREYGERCVQLGSDSSCGTGNLNETSIATSNSTAAPITGGNRASATVSTNQNNRVKTSNGMTEECNRAQQELTDRIVRFELKSGTAIHQEEKKIYEGVCSGLPDAAARVARANSFPGVSGAGNNISSNSSSPNSSTTSSVDSCRQKIILIQTKGDADAKAASGNALAQGRAFYNASAAQEALFSGECASDPQARSYVSSARSAMSEWGSKSIHRS